MTSAQQKAEAYVREKLDLFDRYHVSRGNNLRCKNCGEPNTFDNHGKCKKGDPLPLSLHHWLRVLGDKVYIEHTVADGFLDVCEGNQNIRFDLPQANPPQKKITSPSSSTKNHETHNPRTSRGDTVRYACWM